MCTEDFIIALFCRIDEKMRDVPKHPQAALHPGEIVTLALLFAIKGVGNRAKPLTMRSGPMASTTPSS